MLQFLVTVKLCLTFHLNELKCIIKAPYDDTTMTNGDNRKRYEFGYSNETLTIHGCECRWKENFREFRVSKMQKRQKTFRKTKGFKRNLSTWVVILNHHFYNLNDVFAKWLWTHNPIMVNFVNKVAVNKAPTFVPSNRPLWSSKC